MTTITAAFPTFLDLGGDPLDQGYIYVGEPNQNPQTSPKQVYWDAALTIPAAQPIRTLAGYIVRNGAPANLYVNGQYSITVLNRGAALVYTKAIGNELLQSAGASEIGINDRASGSRFSTVQGWLDYLLSSVGSRIVGFIQAGTGAVARFVESKLRDSVSVKDFGAVGDGSTDDSAAIQLAVNSGAKLVVFPYTSSSYYGADVTLPEGVRVKGYGVAKLKLKPLVGAIGGGFHAFFKANGANDVTVDGFVIDGNAGAQTPDAPNIDRYAGLYFVDCNRLTVKGNRFTSAPYGAWSIRVRQGSNVRVVENYVVDLGIYYNAYSGAHYDVSIDRNETNNCGISINDDQVAQTLFGWSISDNKIRGNNAFNEAGIGARASDGTIDSNDIQGGYFVITASSGGSTFVQHDLIVSNNNIVSNTGSFNVYGLEHYAKNITIVGNKFVNCAIVTSNGTGENVTISGNKFSATLATSYTEPAISFAAGDYTGVSITGNTMKGYGTFVNASKVDNMTITGNYAEMVLDPGESQFFAFINGATPKTVTGLVIEGNTIINADRGFVYFDGLSSGGAITVDRMRVANNSLGANSYEIVYFGATFNNNCIYSPSNHTPTYKNITYSASMTPDAIVAHDFIISASNGTAFTINNPTNGYSGQILTITVRNVSGGALGAVTWGGAYKMAAWTSPADANSRSISFRYNGTNWVEISRTAADVPN